MGIKTKEFTFGVTYTCYGTATIDVPVNFTQEQAEQYVLDHWNDMPLPSGEYILGSDEPDFENSELEG